MDSAVDMKKRKRLAQLKAKAAVAQLETGAPEFVTPAATAAPASSILGMADCDLGASPQISKGSVFTKKQNGMMTSPIQHAAKFKLGRRNWAVVFRNDLISCQAYETLLWNNLWIECDEQSDTVNAIIKMAEEAAREEIDPHFIQTNE